MKIEETNQESIEIRDYRIGDKNFIFSTFLRGLYHGDFFYQYVPKSIFMDKYHQVLEYLLSKKDIIVKVATFKYDKDVILGYAILEQRQDANIIHYAFVKKAWRGLGISKALVSEDFKVATHMTKQGLAIASKTGIIYNPFILT